MTIVHDPVKHCAGANHQIASFSLVRCHHRESYTLTVWFAIDHSDDNQTIYRNEVIDFGPFDRSEDIEARVDDEVEALLMLALTGLRASEADGSL